MPQGMTDLNSLISDRRDIDFANEILQLEPNAAPLTVILGNVAKRPTQEAEFRWFEEEPSVRILALSTGPNDTVSDITLPDVSGIFPGDLLKATLYTSGGLLTEMMRVTAINRTTKQVTVIRGYGDSDAEDFSDATADNPVEIITMGNVSAEGSGAPDDRRGQPAVIRNIVGITKTPFSVTGTVDRSRQRANPQERARLQRYWGREHRKDIEMKVIFGEKAEVTDGNGRVFRVTKGITSFIKTNLIDLEGNLTYDKLVEAAERIFEYGSEERWVFAGSSFLSKVALMGSDLQRLEPAEEEFGVKFRRLITPHGTFRLVAHPMFRGAVYSRAALVLDIATEAGVPLVAYRPLQNGGDTRLQLNIQNNDEDLVRDQYFTEAGVQLAQEKRHAILFNAAPGKGGSGGDNGDGDGGE